jgi:predicted TIM-barrel fold metal-dependent hydrolase
MQYRGLSPDDEKYEPYFALAEELDIPVAIHMGEGPPGGVHTIGPPTYRVKLGSPLLLEEVLVRHPKLRVYVMHYGSPLVDEMIAMLFSHSNLYVDIACNNWAFPRKQFYEHLRKMVDAGFEKRIMFGSDQMIWPGTIDKAIESVERAPFLSRSQKRDILYNNAARFLRLSNEEIKRDHGK